MSDFRFRRLERHKVGGTTQDMQLSIPIPKSPSGKIYRFCPLPDCEPNLFQIGDSPINQSIELERSKLIRRKPSTTGITCPYCGHDAPDEEYNYPDDVNAVKDYVIWAAEQDVGDAVEQWARDLNRQLQRSGGGLFSMKMDVKRNRKSAPFVWREDLLRDLTCDTCGRRYGVYAIALFCPDCGARNLHVHYAREKELVKEQVKLAEQVERDGNGELAYRLLGNAHEDVLTVFETYLKTIYRFLLKRRFPEDAPKLGKKSAIGNKFQNIERGRSLFSNIGIDPYSHLTQEDLEFLQLNIEKRHVVGHNLSMADEAYSQAASSEQPGQTVKLLADEIIRFAEVCGTVVTRLEEESPEFFPPVKEQQ